MNEAEYQTFYEDLYGRLFRNRETRRLVWGDRERTKKLIVMMKMAGLSDRDVANMLEVNVKTLRKHFRYELTNSKNIMVSLVAQKLFNTAMNGNVVASIFYLKTQGRWAYAKEIPDESDNTKYGVMQVPSDKLIQYDEARQGNKLTQDKYVRIVSES